MKFIEKIKNRYNILIILLFIMMMSLVLKLATLTIVKGDEYRDKSDNKRIRDVYTSAPRGEIRDRNGELLAASVPSFTVQIMKDEFKLIETKEEKNDLLLELLRLLEKDGTFYKDEYPIEFNSYKYKSEEDYNNEEFLPLDKVVNTLIEHNLLPVFLDSYYKADGQRGQSDYITIDKFISALEHKGIKIPIKTSIDSNGLNVYFDDKENIEEWKEQNRIPMNLTVKESLLHLIDNDKTIIRNVLENSIARKLAFDILSPRGLVDNIELEDAIFIYDNDFKQQKRVLMREFKKINFDTKAKEDFMNIMIETKALDDLLLLAEENKVGELFVAGESLMDLIEKKDLKSPVKILVDKEKKKVSYENIDKNNKKASLEVLKEFIFKNKLLDEFISKKEVSAYAQSVVLAKGYNPKISVSEWEYMSLVNKYDLLEKYKSQGLTKKSTARETLDVLVESYKINPNLSDYEKRGILALYDQMDKQGHRAYEPISIAWGIKEETVAKIEEGFMNNPCVGTSVEPIRYYPKGEHAAHILGYLGKISQENEIEEYVKKKKYSRNDLIGKTGIEQSMEDKLKGKDGIKRVEVDVVGNTTGVLSEEKAVPGNNVQLTIDSKVQEAAEKALEHGLKELQVGGSFKSEFGNFQFGRNNKKGRPFRNATSGSVVAVNVKTGELLALANYPAYDPNLFSTGISSTDWNSLFPDDERDLLAPRPLYNIGIQTAVQPGSTFKMITGLTALEKGLSPSKSIYDRGFVQVGDTKFRCLIWSNGGGSHGAVNFYDALKVSCNYYFYKVATGGEGVKITIDDIAETAKKLGMNDKSGLEINIPAETAGNVPNPEKKIEIDKALFKRFLNNNLKNFVKEDHKKTEKQVKDDIEKIVAWMDRENKMTKAEVVNELANLGYDGEMKLRGAQDLADEVKYTYLNQTGWTLSNTLNVTIGQGHNAYTPMQMANAVATMVNGGKLNKITAIDKISNFDDSETIYKRKHEYKETGFNVNNLEAVKEGMRRVAREPGGTARRAFQSFPIEVGAKTGTAENAGINPVTKEKYDDYSWFVSYGPYEDPEIAVAVVIFQGGGGSNGSPIAREVMAEYFKLTKEYKDQEKEEVEEAAELD